MNWQLHLVLELSVALVNSCMDGSKNDSMYLLDILLKDTQLQALMQPHFAVLPDVFQLSLVMQHLVDDVQDVVHSLRVIRRCRQ